MDSTAARIPIEGTYNFRDVGGYRVDGGVTRSGSSYGADAPVVVHCTAGKDRTGIVVALALLAVGVDRETVVSDYALTEANLQGPWLEGMLELVRGYGVEVTPDLRIILGGSPREALETT